MWKLGHDLLQPRSPAAFITLLPVRCTYRDICSISSSNLGLKRECSPITRGLAAGVPSSITYDGHALPLELRALR